MTPERKVVVITGASRGIGAQLSKAYRHIGYQVIASSRSMCKSDDPVILVIEGDITRPETAERILGIAAERFGRIDTLVNNAGIFIPKPFTEYSEKDFATVIAVNLAGFFYLSQKAAASMLRMGSGHIVNITTTIAEQPVASLPAALAALTKGGLNAISRSETERYRIFRRSLRSAPYAPGNPGRPRCDFTPTRPELGFPAVPKRSAAFRL